MLAAPPRRPLAGRAVGFLGDSGVAASPSMPLNSSSSEIPSSVTIAYSVLTERRDFPVSNCEIALGEIPSRRASSRRLS